SPSHSAAPAPGIVPTHARSPSARTGSSRMAPPPKITAIAATGDDAAMTRSDPTENTAYDAPAASASATPRASGAPPGSAMRTRPASASPVAGYQARIGRSPVMRRAAIPVNTGAEPI